MGNRLKESDKWETPKEVFKYLSDCHGPFDLDVCALKETAKVDNYYGPDRNEDGLKMSWYGKVWCNPPYSNPLPWVEKAIEEKKNGAVTCMLLPADVSTKWFRLMAKNSMYYFWDGRISFLLNGKKIGSPKFGSVVALFFPRLK